MSDESNSANVLPEDLVVVQAAPRHQGVSKMLRPVWVYLVHVVVGTALFLLISSAALGIDLWVRWLRSLDVSRLLIMGCQGAEYAVFIADLFAYGVYLVRATGKLVKEIW